MPEIGEKGMVGPMKACGKTWYLRKEVRVETLARKIIQLYCIRDNDYKGIISDSVATMPVIKQLSGC